MRFAITSIWREPSDHLTDCYFCMVDPTKRRKGKNALPIEYPNIPSSIAPVSHNTTDLLVPQTPTRDQSCLAETSFENSKKEESASLSSAICRRRQIGDERCPYYPN